MSTKGKKLSTITRRRISIAKTKHTKADLIASAITYIEHLNANPDELPTLAGYCLEAGIHPTNLLDYAIKYPKVRHYIDTIRLSQEQYCLTMGIKNRANPIFSMFLLKSKHGFIDQPKKLEQTNHFNISPELLVDAIKLMDSSK